MQGNYMKDIIQTIVIDENFLPVDPNSEGEPTFRLHDLFKYAREKGVDPCDLPYEEIEQFIIAEV